MRRVRIESGKRPAQPLDFTIYVNAYRNRHMNNAEGVRELDVTPKAFANRCYIDSVHESLLHRRRSRIRCYTEGVHESAVTSTAFTNSLLHRRRSRTRCYAE